MAGILYIVGTPIGNLDDITIRAQVILKEVEAVICEDTRVASKLLKHLNIRKKLYSINQHSKTESLAYIVNLLKNNSLAYITDAGTPGLADPGGKLVSAAVRADIQVVPIPGPSALVSAISIAGINLQEFIFLGWPPHKKGRQTFFNTVAESKQPVIFFESTHRIIKALLTIAELMPTRQLIVAREMTKKFETIYRGIAPEVINQLEQTSAKGEFVVIVDSSEKS